MLTLDVTYISWSYEVLILNYKGTIDEGLLSAERGVCKKKVQPLTMTNDTWIEKSKVQLVFDLISTCWKTIVNKLKYYIGQLCFIRKGILKI